MSLIVHLDIWSLFSIDATSVIAWNVSVSDKLFRIWNLLSSDEIWTERQKRHPYLSSLPIWSDFFSHLRFAVDPFSELILDSLTDASLLSSPLLVSNSCCLCNVTGIYIAPFASICLMCVMHDAVGEEEWWVYLWLRDLILFKWFNCFRENWIDWCRISTQSTGWNQYTSRGGKDFKCSQDLQVFAFWTCRWLILNVHVVDVKMYRCLILCVTGGWF